MRHPEWLRVAVASGVAGTALCALGYKLYQERARAAEAAAERLSAAQKTVSQPPPPPPPFVFTCLWDFENVMPSSNTCGAKFVRRITHLLQRVVPGCAVRIIAVGNISVLTGDDSKFRELFYNEMRAQGVDMFHVPARKPESADKALLCEFAKFCFHAAPDRSGVAFLSGDFDFSLAMCTARSLGFRVALFHPHCDSYVMENACDVSFAWKRDVLNFCKRTPRADAKANLRAAAQVSEAAQTSAVQEVRPPAAVGNAGEKFASEAKPEACASVAVSVNGASSTAKDAGDVQLRAPANAAVGEFTTPVAARASAASSSSGAHAKLGAGAQLKAAAKFSAGREGSPPAKIANVEGKGAAIAAPKAKLSAAEQLIAAAKLSAAEEASPPGRVQPASNVASAEHPIAERRDPVRQGDPAAWPSFDFPNGSASISTGGVRPWSETSGSEVFKSSTPANVGVVDGCSVVSCPDCYPNPVIGGNFSSPPGESCVSCPRVASEGRDYSRARVPRVITIASPDTTAALVSPVRNGTIDRPVLPDASPDESDRLASSRPVTVRVHPVDRAVGEGSSSVEEIDECTCAHVVEQTIPYKSRAARRKELRVGRKLASDNEKKLAARKAENERNIVASAEQERRAVPIAVTPREPSSDNKKSTIGENDTKFDAVSLRKQTLPDRGRLASLSFLVHALLLLSTTTQLRWLCCFCLAIASLGPCVSHFNLFTTQDLIPSLDPTSMYSLYSVACGLASLVFWYILNNPVPPAVEKTRVGQDLRKIVKLKPGP